VADRGSAFAIDPDGSHEVQIGTGDVGCSASSPDGKQVLCAAWFDGIGARPATAGLDGSAFRVLDAYPDRHFSLSCADWFPDGTRFMCTSDWDRTPDKSDLGLYTVRATDGGDLARVTAAPKGCIDSDQVLSGDGRHIVFDRICGADEHGRLYSIDPDGTHLVQLSPDAVYVSDPFVRLAADWSPDGKQVAFGALVPAVDSTALYVVGADGTGLREIVPTTTGAVSARWSPDGLWIAFTSRYRSQPQVWLVHPDGSGLVQLTKSGDGIDSGAPSWSPDGTRLVFTRFKDGTEIGDGIWLMDTDGGHPTRLAETPHLDIGTWIPAPSR
jgi:Tol biopolymer transport system component